MFFYLCDIINKVIKLKKILSISFLCILLDQIVKFVIDNVLNFTDSINIISNFFRITYLKNTGAAWSILSGNRILLILVTVIALGLIYIFLIKNKKINKFETINYGLLIGGIIGNLIDRIRLGYVIDYLDFNFGSYNYPVFNIADICIVVSAILLVLNIKKEGD